MMDAYAAGLDAKGKGKSMSKVTSIVENIITVNLDLPYKLNLVGQDGKLAIIPRQVSEGIIASAINILYPQSMPKTDGKIWAGIQDKLFEEQDALYLDKTEFDWLYRQLDKWEPPALFASRYWVLAREFERIKTAQG